MVLISSSGTKKGHAVCIPFPAQGHVSPMLNLAKHLHQKGFHITFVNTEYNRNRILTSCGPASLDGLPDFHFATIPDGLPLSDKVIRNAVTISASTSTTCLEPFCELLSKLINNSCSPPVSCIVADGVMSFTVKAAERFGLPEVLFWTTSACGFYAYTQYKHLVEKGYVPLKDMSQVTNGYMETIIDWIPGIKDFQLKDFPSFIRTTDPNDIMLNFFIKEVENVPRAKAVIINTFNTLEYDALNALSAMFDQRIYTIGPLHLMMNNDQETSSNAIKFSFWKEEPHCIEWLESKEPQSILYVNFGSVTVVTVEQLTEFAWGLANSEKPFLWIIRPNLISGASAVLPPEFLAETKDRSMLISWCDQEQVLKHPAIGGFLTHSGWNSTIESIVGGAPVICWPFFAEQQTNCRYSCVEWEIGMEIDNDVKRDEVEVLVRELMDGDKGKKMKEKAMEWKRKAEEATALQGSSYLNLDKLIKEVLLHRGVSRNFSSGGLKLGVYSKI